MLKGHKHILIPKYYKGSFFEKTAKATIAVILAFLSTLLFAAVNNTHAESLTLSISSSDVVLNLAPTSANGTFAESSPISVTASTDSSSGYTLSIHSSTGSTDLTNTTDHTSKITSISTNLTNSDFSNSANTQYNNKWGYKPSQWVTVNDDTHTTTANTGNNAVFRPLPDDTGEIIAITDCANGTSSCTSATDTYTLSMGARVGGSLPTGSYESDTFVITAVTNSNIVECDNTKLCVQFDANGLTFPATSAQDQRFVNNVNYDSTTTQQQITKYSHTPNINDDGSLASENYANSQNITDVVTIDGASSLNVTIYYDTESTSYDWVTVYESPFDISNGNDATISATTGNKSGKLAGRNSSRTNDYSTWYSQTYTISGDTVKFHFKSDGSQVYHGYYAIITGTGTTHSRTVSSGEYATPTGNNAIFYGWSTTQTTPGSGLPSEVEYANAEEVETKIPGNNGDEVVLYAVWQQGQPITFTKDSNVASIEVLESDGTTVGTITASGQSLVLLQGNTYTLKPTHADGYTTNTITIASGGGTLSGKQFTVGSTPATINTTSKIAKTIASSTTMQEVEACPASLTTGQVYTIKDSRDNQSYKVAKLKDGKCWLLDNLALDLTNSTVLNGMDESNTNASNTTLGYLKGTTTGTTSDQYATAAVSNWTSSYSFSTPLVNMTNKDVIPTDATSTAGGYKVGGYYNYCAATAGSYCYGNGTSAGTSSGNATEDICPKGWRMPGGSSTVNLTATPPTGEYQNLYNNSSYNTYANYRSALRLPLSGAFNNGSASDQGSNGYWWSSTRYASNSMYHLNANMSNISPASSNVCRIGYSVRCVLGS